MQVGDERTKKPERKNMQLYIGQMLRFIETNRNGDRIKKTIQIKKLYRHHVLCRVNATYNECFSYEEIMKMGGGSGQQEECL